MSDEYSYRANAEYRDFDLPPPDTKRWVTRPQGHVVNAVRAGVISLEGVCRRYELSVEEFLAWQRAIEPTECRVYASPATNLSRQPALSGSKASFLSGPRASAARMPAHSSPNVEMELSRAELEVRIHLPPAVSLVRTCRPVLLADTQPILCRLDRHRPSYATCVRVDDSNHAVS